MVTMRRPKFIVNYITYQMKRNLSNLIVYKKQRPTILLTAMIKSKIKPKASLVALGGGYYAAGTDNLKRLLENLPKKLYYSNHQPSSWDWHDHIIVKL